MKMKTSYYIAIMSAAGRQRIHAIDSKGKCVWDGWLEEGDRFSVPMLIVTLAAECKVVMDRQAASKICSQSLRANASVQEVLVVDADSVGAMFAAAKRVGAQEAASDTELFRAGRLEPSFSVASASRGSRRQPVSKGRGLAEGSSNHPNTALLNRIETLEKQVQMLGGNCNGSHGALA